MRFENPALQTIMGRARSLPERFERMRPMWVRAMESCLPSLTGLFGQETTFQTLTLSLSDSIEMRKRHPEPGLLIATESGGQSDHFVRLAESSITEISALLLQTSTQFERDQLGLEPLDTFLFQSVLQTVFDSISDVLAVSVALSDPIDVQTEWPFRPPGEMDPYFMIQPTFDIGGGITLTFEITFPPDTDGLMFNAETEILGDPQLMDQLLSGSVPVAAILGQVDMFGRHFDRLKVGETIALPDTSMEALSIIPVGSDSAHPLAVAEHGKSGNKHAVRVLSVRAD